MLLPREGGGSCLWGAWQISIKGPAAHGENPNLMWPRQQGCTIKLALRFFPNFLLSLKFPQKCDASLWTAPYSESWADGPQWKFSFLGLVSQGRLTNKHHTAAPELKWFKGHEEPSLLLPSRWAHTSWNLSQSFQCKLSSRDKCISKDRERAA